MRTMKSFGRPLASLLALIGLVALVAAIPATAAKISGKTVLAPKGATLDALADAGVGVTPSGKAKAGNNGISFPIKGGRFDPETGAAKIKHSGGLTFASEHTSVTVENFTVKIGEKNVLKAEVAGGDKLRLADLNIKKVKIKQSGKNKIVVSNVKATLASKAAKALSATFGLPDLTGAVLGKTTTKVKQ